MSPELLIILLVVAILLLSFISGVEAAFYSASRLTIELKKKQRKYSGRVWANYFANPASFVATAIIVFNLLLVITAYLWWTVLSTVWAYWSIDNVYIELIVATVFATFSILLIEFFFRAAFHARATAVIGSGFVTFLTRALLSLFQWLSSILVKASEWLLKYIFNVKLNTKVQAFARPDIDVFVQRLKDNEPVENLDKNNEIFQNIISLNETKVKACLVPRREIIGVKDRVSVDELIRVFSETKLSKLVVYHDTIDQIKGYVHQLDMLKNPADIQSVLKPIPIVPESMNAMDLIKKFSKERKSIAWVIDEFGGTAGIVTMEDLLEEIFGDINDEFDASVEFIDKQISATEYLFSGRLMIDEIAAKYELTFRRSEDTETLSGYIISQHGTIPKEKQRIIIDDYQFDIVSVAKTRIEAVRLKILR